MTVNPECIPERFLEWMLQIQTETGVSKEELKSDFRQKSSCNCIVEINDGPDARTAVGKSCTEQMRAE